MNAWIGSGVKGQTEAQKGELSQLVAYAGLMLNPPSDGAELLPRLLAGVSLGLFLINMRPTFPFDWAAPGEIGCLELGQLGQWRLRGQAARGWTPACLSGHPARHPEGLC